MIQVDVKDRKPIWEQLVENIKTLVVCGAMHPDEQLPSVRALGRRIGHQSQYHSESICGVGAMRCCVFNSRQRKLCHLTTGSSHGTAQKAVNGRGGSNAEKGESHGLTKDIILFTVSEIWDEN